ncbi:hypothetical protein AADR41_22135 [Streptomyces sp. CLV115]|uniref:DUF6892 domain-containing protein n=1 Tax=Streptomyces sp. CLV115 TaxID=3138502 RepID=UPI00313AD3E3
MSKFRDFNLKLLVIEELMYGPEPLLPVYDLPARLAERGIGDPASYVLENGLHAEVLPESRAHFEALEIPTELLARVEELCFDAGADVFRHCAPAWDGEDDLFDVRSLDDLALLPNLREVTFVEDGVRHRHRLSPGTRPPPRPGKSAHRRPLARQPARPGAPEGSPHSLTVPWAC